MTSPTLHVAALQLRAHDRRDFDAAWPGILAAAARTIEDDDVDLLVLPEATIPGYVLGGDDVDDTAMARALAELAALAARTATVIVAGSVVRVGNRLRNAAIAFDRDGSVAGRADKTFLWHFDSRWFEAGDAIEPISTSIGKIGALVCADGRIPTIARALVDRGAQMLVMPTAWVTSGRDPGALENVQADLLARVRAYENGVPFVAANKCGVELGIALYCGKSQIVDASGRTLAIAGERDAEAIAARVDMTPARPHRARVLVPAHAAPRPLPERPIRIAISARDGSALDREHLAWLNAEYAIAPDSTEQLAGLDRAIAVATVDDALAGDPAGIAELRRAGYRVIVWESRSGDGWTRDVARARALESRVYVVVLDRSANRAFAVDPDGAVLCGTFGEYRIAGFDLDARKTTLTAVAPETDVLEAFNRVAAIVARNETSP